MVPDCYEAFLQEERRQAGYDKRSAKWPRCVICGKKIHEGEEAHQTRGKCVCGYCFDELEEDVFYVEIY